ncbi:MULTISPECIES: hypothetical protein [unclassified Mycobacterium]|uniref:hypothetical protein n=1 Tax=unclassified Mycobacterium TaxID=2642494 RepID=UPI003875BFB1
MDEPLKIELISGADLWQSWLPVLGSIIVACAALVVMWRSNKVNREAIDAANARADNDRSAAHAAAEDDRLAARNATNDTIAAAEDRARAYWVEARSQEYRVWRRDTLLRMVMDVVDCAIGAVEGYRMLAYDKRTDASASGALELQNVQVRRLDGLAAAFEVMGEESLKARVLELVKLANRAETRRLVIEMNEAVRMLANTASLSSEATSTLVNVRDNDRMELAAIFSGVEAAVSDFVSASRDVLATSESSAE